LVRRILLGKTRILIRGLVSATFTSKLKARKKKEFSKSNN